MKLLGFKKSYNFDIGEIKRNGGGVGIRTLDGLLAHTHLAGEHLQPLGHSSVDDEN